MVPGTGPDQRAAHRNRLIQDGKLRSALQDAIRLALQQPIWPCDSALRSWLAEANILRTLGPAFLAESSSISGRIPAQISTRLLTVDHDLDVPALPVNNP